MLFFLTVPPFTAIYTLSLHDALPILDLDIEGEVDLGDWDFNVFGDNTNDDRNPDLAMNDDGSVTIEANGGKISSSVRSEEHTSELQSRGHLVCRLLLENKKK